MADSIIDSSAALPLAWIVQFQWGVSSVARYTNWTSDLTVAGNTYTSLVNMGIKPAALEGSISDKPWMIDMVGVPPVDTLGDQRAHPQVRVDIFQVDTLDFSTLRSVFAGTVTRSQSNLNGASGKVTLTVSGWKYQAQWPLGLIADVDCAWTFTDRNCGVDPSGLLETHTITAISGDRITLDSLTTTKLWSKGFVAYDDLGIGIRSYPAGTNTLHLIKIPPSSWLGKNAAIMPGCDKQIATCRAYSNERRFMGCGIAMPIYQPQIESVI